MRQDWLSHMARQSLLMIKAIRRQGRQTGVLHMASGREVVERLKRHVIEPHDPMHRVIKKTADSGSPDVVYSPT